MFKLVNSDNVNSDSNFAMKTNYARWLRVIGQELSSRPFVRCLIEVDDRLFVVRTFRQAQQVPLRNSILNEPIRNRWASLLGKNAKKVSGDETIHYTVDDLEELDRKWAAKKTGTNGTPDIKSLAEAFRSVGKFVDARDGRLLRICKDPKTIVVHYREKNGTKQVEEFSGLSFYKLQQELSSVRQEVKDPWETID